MQPLSDYNPDHIANTGYSEELLIKLAAETAASIGNPHLLQVYSQMFDVHMQHYHLLINDANPQ